MQEELTRHKAYKFHKEHDKKEGHCINAHNTDFFIRKVPTKLPWTGWR